MKGIFFLVEEPSILPVITAIAEKLITPHGYWYYTMPHQGKGDLLQALPTVLPSLSKVEGARIVVALDQDNTDCQDLKRDILEKINGKCHSPFKIRIVCKELEAWFIGDFIAIEKAFPRFSANPHRNKRKYENPDMIIKPSQELMKIIPEYSGRVHLAKGKTAEAISPFLNIENNRSTSFTHFINAIQALLL
ncbi:conserved hypothetical protein [Chloroherpeton thalassium ATCC 35110]|uniref:DUF4276 domain-containing protein n=1 Tax=Chloroherpeton thalassium (strain ATCC 35110 / GB-78) TaxID=517418 RepID=B3QZ47_CHLT3|nr:DUF4276 family protein [Chloroherpeton thalassium]ACF13740.1 conserved hypothetical protein [Chloroherpeton thalassium ATCC 35110]